MSYFGNRLGTDPDIVRLELMNRLDANGDNKLDPEEFIALFKIIFQRIRMKERAKEKFDEFDDDKNGFLE